QHLRYILRELNQMQTPTQPSRGNEKNAMCYTSTCNFMFNKLPHHVVHPNLIVSPKTAVPAWSCLVVASKTVTYKKWLSKKTHDAGRQRASPERGGGEDEYKTMYMA